jgi:asparagine synthase (glutamine-hydrolysing)
MCGLAGFWSVENPSRDILARMGKALWHRGPDDMGQWIDKSVGFALIHRRLSILDLSHTGHQPMLSPCNRYVLAYNGEIYNHKQLRRELESNGGAFNWRGSSDTETLLAGLRHWGIETCLKKLNGMFAFALWDIAEKELYLARDRVGEKPLYYGCNGETFFFGSELKALAVHPNWRGEISRDALALFLRYNNVPGPKSIYHGIDKLPPAHFIKISKYGKQITRPKCYWSLSEIASRGIKQASQGLQSVNSLSNELDHLIRNAVRLRMLGDVQVGAFLSGGCDSSMVVAHMQAESTSPVKTFSIGNVHSDFDEAKHAAKVAQYLGTDHTELYVTAQEALDLIPKLPQIYDEPFADSSQIPTFLVSQLARHDVKVILSGDGGDELFAGYNRHVIGPRIWRNFTQSPPSIRYLLRKLMSLVAEGVGSDALGYIFNQRKYPGLSLKFGKLAQALEASNSIGFYDLLRTHWNETALVVGGSVSYPYSELEGAGLLEQMLYQDMITYLPDDIMTKVDRATMAVSLEARAPFLDPDLIEFAWSVPLQYKVHNGKGKWLLRHVLSRYVPRELTDRPKQGFEIPIAQWLRGPLRDWAESLLSESRLRQEGYLNTDLIRSVWKNHLSGCGNREHDIWCVLMFQAWLETKNVPDKFFNYEL